MNWLIQPFLPLEITERTNVRQRKRVAIFILVAHRSQRKAPVFHGQAATVPVVTRLHRRILQQSQVRVNTEAGGGTQSAFVELSIAQQYAKLVELASACAGRM